MQGICKRDKLRNTTQESRVKIIIFNLKKEKQMTIYYQQEVCTITVDTGTWYVFGAN